MMNRKTTATFNKRAFFQDLGYVPHAGQLRVHSSPAPRRILACGVRWGKTLCAAMEALAAAMVPAERTIGWVVAPTYDLSDRVYDQIERVAGQHLRRRIVSMKKHDRRIILRNLAGGLSEIRAKSADNPVSLLGEGLDFVIVDEAARLKPMIWESHLSQRLIDRRGWALLISTPRGKGYFYDLFRRGQGRDPDYASWNAPSWENPILDKETIDAERARLPERTYQQEFGAQFLEGSGSVFRFVREAATGMWIPPDPNRIYYGGLDLAKVEDYTVLAMLNQQRQLTFVDRFHRIDWDKQIIRLHAASKAHGGPVIVTDTTGIGEPIYERLRGAGCHVQPYPFTARSKADLINNLMLLFEQRVLTIPKPELAHYGTQFDSVEADSTYYACPPAGRVRNWHAVTPAAFVMSTKLPRMAFLGGDARELDAGRVLRVEERRGGSQVLRRACRARGEGQPGRAATSVAPEDDLP